MADKQLQALTEITSLESGDKIYVVRPSDAPADSNKQLQVQNAGFITENTLLNLADTSTIAGSDEFIILQGGAVKRVTWAEVFESAIPSPMVFRGSDTAANIEALTGMGTGDVWIITTGGTIDGVAYTTGDMAIYNGTAWNKVENDADTKADKVSGATAGNLAELDSNGNLVDSGIYISEMFDMTQSSRISGTKSFSVNNEAYCRFERGSDGIWVMELWVEYSHSPGAGNATDITLSGITARVSQPLVVQPSGAATTSSAIITGGNNVINVDYGAVNVAGQLWGRIQLSAKPSATYYTLPN